ncbi:MAG: AAA family ATPase [Candidatus Micrarchaeia archaeon]
MANVVIVVGTPGAGKTSIVSALSKDYKVVNIGTEMLKATEGKVADRDKLRTLPFEDIRYYRAKALVNIDHMPGNIIFDTHIAVKSGNRFVPGFSAEEIKELKNLKSIIYIDATPEEIRMRRERDQSRRRDMDTPEEIAEQRDISINFISTYAAYFGIPIYILKNKENKLDESISEAERICKESFSD